MKVLLALLLSLEASAQALPGGERVEFGSVFGYLYRPASAAKVPAVVIVHGSGGVSAAREGFWARELSAFGMAALVIDSFTPRGVDSTVEDQSRVTTMQMVGDAFAALSFLSLQDFVDPARVAVMGMSKGGAVALLAADRHTLRDGRLPFAAHLPLYPSCSLQYRSPRPSAAPVLMLIGAEDNYVGVRLCVGYAERLRAAGGKAELKTYPGAHHAFDGDTSQQREFFLARAQNYSECVIYIEDDGKLAPWDRGCMRKGATVAANHRAKMQALEDAKAFFKTTLFQ